MTAAPAQTSRLGRSVWALLAGFLVVVALSIGADAVCRALGLFATQGQPPPALSLFGATIYRALFGVLGSYVTARLAPHHPMRHVLIGGCIGIVLGTAGVVAWNPGMGARWYPIALVVLALPQSLLGGWFALRRGAGPDVPVTVAE